MSATAQIANLDTIDLNVNEVTDLSPYRLLDELESCIAQSTIPTGELVQQCQAVKGTEWAAPQKARPIHTVYSAMGEKLLQWEQWEAAEYCAIQALKALPRFGAAFKLLGKSLLGAGFPDDAAICHRYGLPQSMLEKHFSDVPVKWVTSDAPVANTMTKKVAFPAERYDIRPPRQTTSHVIQEFDRKSQQTREAYTTVITEGRLWFDGFNTVVWDRFGNIVRDLYRGFAEVVQGSLGDAQPNKIAGRVCLLGNRNAVNYYHWMHDILPRLEVLRAAGESLEDIDFFVCNPIQFDFQRQTLAKLGIAPERLISIDDAQYIEADELLMPVYGSNSLGKFQAVWNPMFYKREYLRGKALPAPHQKLYVSRGSKGARGVVNDDEIVEYLEARGFTTVRAENLTVEQQADLFASASVVLGPHGAGFSNIVFCQPGTKVIELFNAHIVPCFHVISEQSELEHYIHFCDVFDDESRPEDNEKYHRTMDARRVSPFRVELTDIDEILSFAGVS